MQGSVEERPNRDQDLYSETILSQDFDAQLKLSKSSGNDDLKRKEVEAMEDFVDEEEEEEEEEGEGEDEEEEEEEEFSFTFGENTSPIAAEDLFIDGQIKPVFPLFNRDLLFSGEDSKYLDENLPMRPPVKKVFVETNELNDKATTSTPGNGEIAGPYCEWSSRKAVEASSEVCKKSNSTGFSKIWRLKEFVGRCNSDGRDAFVFLNKTTHAPPPKGEKSAEKTTGENREKKKLTVKTNGKVKKSGKSKTASLSAHEVYLRSKAKEEERRRSYLPYRPELMGFFTTVNGGLTKNVHPF